REYGFYGRLAVVQLFHEKPKISFDLRTGLLGAEAHDRRRRFMQEHREEPIGKQNRIDAVGATRQAERANRSIRPLDFLRGVAQQQPSNSCGRCIKTKRQKPKSKSFQEEKRQKPKAEF